MEKMIKILIADDHALMRQGLKQLLELEDDITVIGDAVDGLDVLDKVSSLQPDLVLLDINMPNMNGIQALRKIKEQGLDTKIIMLTIHDEREYLLETINLGADGYVLKDADANSLVNAIRTVDGGTNYIHPTLASELVRAYKRKDEEPEESKRSNLTRREFEVLCLIADGNNNKEIADKLFISEKTVKNHVSNIFKKIHVNDRTQAAIYAIKNNLKPLS